MADYIKTQAQVWQEEHDSGQTGTKKVLLYGWDYDNQVKRRIAVDSDGKLMISGSVATTPTTYKLLMESGDALLMENGDALLLESAT